MESVFVVRPNLGRPLILSPSGIRSFEITVAGRSPEFDTPFNPAPECPTAEDVLEALEDLQITWFTGQRHLVLPLTFREWVVEPTLYLDMDPDIWRFNPKLSEQSPFISPSFPQNGLEHQHFSGFRWEGRLTVGIDMPDGWTPEGRWPAMCSVRLGDRTNPHAVYVTERPPNPNDFRFIHLTDTHVASRHDLMAQVICQHLEPWEETIFRARFRNYNDHLRAVIRYANRQASEGKLDFIVLTGDVIDYYHDGYFKGDTYRYGYGKSAPTIPSNETSNIRKFVDIMTGRDGKGEALTVPLFVVPGNHEYLRFEPLGALNIDPESDVPGWLDFLRVFVVLFPLAWFALPFLPSEFWHLPADDEFNEKMDRHRTFGLYKPEILMFDLWKKGEDARYRVVANKYKKDGPYASWPKPYEETQSLYEGFRYLKPRADHFGQYLSEISYDPDFVFSVGRHQFVCLNTGQDVHLPSVDDIIAVEGDIKKLPREKRRYAQDHPHNRGFIPEHGALLAKARQAAGRQGLVFVLSHAPLVHHPDRGLFGMARTDTNDLNKAPAEMYLDYDIAEGAFHMARHQGDGFTLSLAGHNHDTSEYHARLSQSPDPGRPFRVECYWGKISEDMLGTPEWLNDHRPLFFTSGSLKSRHPMARCVHVSQNRLVQGKMNEHIPRLTQAAEAGPLACFLTGVVSHFSGISGYKGNLKKPIDPSFLTGLYESARQTDRAVVMWDAIDNFVKMHEYLGFILTLGGYRGLWGDPHGICDQEDLTVHEAITGWDWLADGLLERRNRGLPEDLPGGEKTRERYARLRAIHDEIEVFLKQISGWIPWGGEAQIPLWYENWSVDPEGFPFSACRLTQLLSANILLWLNRFGLAVGGDGSKALDLAHQFTSIDPYALPQFVFDCQKRILALFEFAALDDDHPLRLCYTFESTYLAKLGGYKVGERNERDPSIHLAWASSLPRDAVVADITVKYQLQAEHQLEEAGMDGLRRFYSITSPRLAAWGTTNEHLDPDHYMDQCAGWTDQRILDDLMRRVGQLVQKLVRKEE
jgi:hypothetical protein